MKVQSETTSNDGQEDVKEPDVKTIVEGVAIKYLDNITRAGSVWRDKVQKICQAVEVATSVEACFLLQRSHNLMMTERDGQNIVIELKDGEVFQQVIQSRKPIIVNDATKDRHIAIPLKE